MTEWRAWLPIVGLSLVAASSFWLLRSLDGGNEGERPQAHVPDYRLRDYSLVEWDAQGQVIRRAQGAALKHYPDTGTELERPYLVAYQDGQPLLFAHSERGHASTDNSQIQLLGRSWLWRYNTAGERLFHLISADMLLLIDEEYAETSAPSQLFMSSANSSGIGLRAYLGERRVELLSQVKTVYEKTSPTP